MAVANASRRLEVVLTADIASLQRGLHIAQRTFEATSRRMIAIGQNLAFSLGLPIAGLSTAIVKFTSDFEDATNRLVTLTNVPRKSIAGLEEAVTRLSDHLGVDKIDQMRAAYAVAGAGISDVTQIMEILEVTAQGVVIGLGDQEQLARTVTQIMAAYGAENVNAARAMNALVLGVREGNFEAPQLGESIGEIIGITAEMGISIEEIVAGIAAYTAVIGDAGKATTGFRNILTDILSPSKQAEKLWQQLFKGGVGELRERLSKDLLGTLKAVADALEGSPALADKLFDNVRGLEAFLSVFSSRGQEVIDIYNRMIENTTSLDAAWNEILTSWSRISGIIRGQLRALAVEFGETLLPVIKDVALNIAAWVRALRPLIVEHSDLIAVVGLSVIGFTALTVALGTFGLLLSSIFGAILAVGSALTGLIAILGTIGGFLISPWGAGIAAILGFLSVVSLVGSETQEAARSTASGWLEIGNAVNRSSAEIVQSQGAMASGWFELAGVVDHTGKTIEQTAKTTATTWQLSWELAITRAKILFHEFVLFAFQELKEFFSQLSREFAALEARGGLLGGSFKFLGVSDFLADAELDMLDAIVRWQSDLNDLAGRSDELVNQLFGIDALRAKVDEFIKEWTTQRELIDKFFADLEKSLGGKDIKLGEVGAGLDENLLKKQESALDKIADLIRGNVTELSALEGGWNDFTKQTIEQLGQIEEAGREGGLAADLVDRLSEALRRVRAELEKRVGVREGLLDIAQIVRGEAVELGELSARWTEFEKETAAGLRQIDEIATRLKLPVEEVERYRQAYIRLREEIEKQNRMIVIDIGSAFTTAFEGITRGLLQGTQDWRSILEIFSDIGIGIFFDIFTQIVKQKLKLDKIVLPNFEKTIPEAIQKTVEEIKKVSEVLSELGDKELAEIVIATEISDLEAMSRARDEILATIDAIKAGAGSFESIGKGIETVGEAAEAARASGGPLIRQRPLGGAGEAAPTPTGPVPVEVVKVNESILSRIGSFFVELYNDIRGAIFDTEAKLSGDIEDLGRDMDQNFGRLERVSQNILAQTTALTTLDKNERTRAIVGAIGSIAGAIQGARAVHGQHGGIVKSRTNLIAGEAGPEALIPLERLHQFFEREPAEATETTVIVNSPHPATVRENRRGLQREIEVVIDDAIARSFRTGGRASQALESSFGVRRAGGTR